MFFSRQAEEFKEEIAASPMGEEEYNEELSEPPPPGGESLEEVRVPTPTVDEKPPGESTPDTVKQSPTAPAKTVPPPVNNLSILAQKAPLIALQQALLQGNPLLLGIIISGPRDVKSVLLTPCKYRYNRLTEYTTNCPDSTRANGDATYSSFFTISSIATHSKPYTDGSRSAAVTATGFWAHSTAHDCSASHSHTASRISSIYAAP